MTQFLNDSSFLERISGRTREINLHVMEAPLPDIRYPEIVPVNTNYADWQALGGSSEWTISGEADWITGNSDDVPKVGLAASEKQFGFALYGIGYGWNLEELGKAAEAGVSSLTDKKARAARRKSEEFAQSVAMIGDPVKQWYGFTNQPATIVPRLSATAAWRTGTALTATIQQILADVTTLVDGPINAVIDPYFRRATHLGLDTATYRLLRLVLADPNDITSPSALDFIERKLGVTVLEVPELSTAGDDGKARAVGYRREEDVVELPMPFAYRFHDAQRNGPFKYEIPGWGRIGGVQINQAGGFRYMDGISA